VHGFVSPRLGIRFDLSGPELVVYRPDGTPFLTAKQLDDLRLQAVTRANRAERLLGRVMELSRKVRLQQVSAEELAELERLQDEDTAQPGSP
jgi:hypothetical protein